MTFELDEDSGYELVKRNKEIIANYQLTELKLLKENFKKDHPTEPIPDWMENGFSLSRALSVMAAETERLKNIVGVKDNI